MASQALVRYEEKPRGLLGRLRGAMEKWTVAQGGPELEARLARLIAPQNEYGVDPFGLELGFARAALAPGLWLYRNYFRVETHGIEQVPPGRVMLIANHSGQLPLDAWMLGLSMLIEAEPPRIARAMIERWVQTLPFIAPLYARMGQVVGTPENCRRLLAAGETIMVFPEGVRGLNKTYDKKYQLQEFGTGFLRIAQEMNAPIVPVGVVGAEEQAPSFFDFKAGARLLNLPALPIGVPLPLPVKYHLWFGAPMRFSDDETDLESKVREVKAAVQSLLRKGLDERKGRIF